MKYLVYRLAALLLLVITRNKDLARVTLHHGEDQQGQKILHGLYVRRARAVCARDRAETPQPALGRGVAAIARPAGGRP